MRKPVEIERQMLAANATEYDVVNAKSELNDAARRQFPEYRYASERQYTQGKLLHVCRTYEYSRWKAFWVRLKSLLPGNDSEVTAQH